MLNNVKQKAVILGFFFATAVFVQLSAASCLDINEIISIQALEQQMNVTNNTLLAIFEAQCSRCYSYSEVDELLNLTNYKMDLQVEYIELLTDGINFEEIDQKVDQRMQNYTEWFEDEIELKQLLWVIYNNTNTTSAEGKYATKDYINEELGGFSNQLDVLEGKVTAVKFNLTNANTMQQLQSTSETDYTWIYAIIALLVLAFFANMHYKWVDLGSSNKQQIPLEEPVQYYNDRRANATTHEGIVDIEMAEDIEDTRRKQAVEVLNNKIHKQYMKQIDNAETPKKAMEIAKEYEKIKDNRDKANRGELPTSNAKKVTGKNEQGNQT